MKSMGLGEQSPPDDIDIIGIFRLRMGRPPTLPRLRPAIDDLPDDRFPLG